MSHPAAVAGATRAADHADRVHATWTDRAYAYLMLWAKSHGDKSFLAEEVRLQAELAQGYVAPPDSRAWGAVFMSAKRNGVLTVAGYAPSESSNGSPKCLWRLA